MTKRIYSLFDKKVEGFGSLVTFPNDRAAIASFSRLVEIGEDSMWAKCPYDFALYLIGTFDDESGTFVPDFQLLQDFGALFKPKSKE